MVLTFSFYNQIAVDYASHPQFVNIDIGGVIFNGVISLVLVLFNNISFFFNLRKIKESEKAGADLYDKAKNLDDKIRELETESTKLTGDIRRFIHDFIRKDRLIMRDNKSR